MLKFLMSLLILSMLNTFPLRATFNDYTTTKWTKFFSCLCLFDIDSLFKTSTPPTSSNQLHKFHKKLSPECFSCSPMHMLFIISSRVGLLLPFSEGTPHSGTASFWSKFKITPYFWEPSKLVHVNCMKHF